MRLFVPSLTYLPSHRPCPHPHTPHPTEQAPSDCRNRHTVKEHKGIHTGPATMAATLGEGRQPDAFVSHLVLSSPKPGLGDRGLLSRLLSVRGGSLLYPRYSLLPLLSSISYSRRSPSADPAGGPVQARTTQGPPTREGQWRMKPLRTRHLSCVCPSCPKCVCVGRSAPNSRRWGRGWTFKLLETE